MKKRIGERPEGRIQGKSRSQMRREDIMNREEGQRTRIKTPKPKEKPQLSSMCVNCGSLFTAAGENNTVCPKCSSPGF
jgi:ribosomal protein S27AE